MVFVWVNCKQLRVICILNSLDNEIFQYIASKYTVIKLYFELNDSSSCTLWEENKVAKVKVEILKEKNRWSAWSAFLKFEDHPSHNALAEA